MSVYLALLIVFGLFAFGDFLGVYTKAKLSSVFVALGLFLVLFLVDAIPDDIITIARMKELSSISSMFLVFNMGSSINLVQMKREWKVVVMSMFAMFVAVGSVFAVSPFIGYEAAVVSIPIVNGGIVATQIMTAGALEQGFTMAAALGTIVFAVQKFVGTIPASRCGLSEAKILSAKYRESLANGVDLNKVVEGNAGGKPAKTPLWQKHEKYFTVYFCLGVTAFCIYIASLINGVTGVSGTIWSLLIGMIMNQLGFIPAKILDRAKVSGIFMVASFCSLIPSLANISIADLSALAFQTAMVFGAVLVGTFAVIYFLPTWKFVGSRNLAIGIAMSQLLGFPATLLITTEVATAVSETAGERDYIIDQLTPAFVISGFVSVTTISVLMAGVFVGLL